MGDDQRARQVQAFGQLNGSLNPLARDDPRWLEQKILIWRHAKRRAQIIGVAIGRTRRVLKIHHVRHHQGTGPSAQSQLLLAIRVDRHVHDRVESCRKGSAQVIIRRTHTVAGAFPGEVVMMGDGRHFSFGDQLRQRQAERDVHRNGHRVFDDQDIQLEATHKSVQVLFQMILDVFNSL